MAEQSSSPAEFAVFDRDLDAAWTERYLQSPRLAVDTEAMGLILGVIGFVWFRSPTPRTVSPVSALP